MKKVISLLFIILLWSAVWVKAQEVQNTREPNVWLDLQMAESFGLNDWNRVKFASDRLPNTSFATDMRLTLNVYVIRKKAGLFHDIGLTIMPAPRDGFSDPAAQATRYTGIPFHTKEITIEDGYQSSSAHFKMTIGLFGNFSASEKLSVSPRLGVGFMTISSPTCEAVLKEQDANMQYIARYQWFGQADNNEEFGNLLGYLTYRLRFSCKTSSKIRLLFGIEYTWHFTRANFSETYTNYFNPNIVKTSSHKGNQLNMLGLSLGVSF